MPNTIHPNPVPATVIAGAQRMTDAEYELLKQADAHVASMLPRADAHTAAGAYPLWHGWALREAWLAGHRAAAEHARTILAMAGNVASYVADTTKSSSKNR